MSKVIVEHSISLDGFSTGPDVTTEEPMGTDGELLHAWMFPARAINAGVKDAMFSSAGAVIVGRRMFDLAFGPWGEEPPFHLPVFVLTHRLRDPIPMRGGTTYHFVSGVETTF